jgi:UDP-N-acetylmuramoyl-tripeptide--D-alanyl-D-alanine ligase
MFTIAELLQATSGTLKNGHLSSTVNGVSIDSRTLKKGDIFVAICGPRFDGHQFIPAVIKKGAGALVVSQTIPRRCSIPVIEVDDTTKALGQIGAFHRRRFQLPVIAITGSAGKTTSKDLIASVLSSRYRVLKNEKSENNQYGIPLTLLKLTKSHQIAVLELGTNRPGDIAWLASLVRPSVAVLTNIGSSHLKELKTPQGVFKEKMVLLDFIEREGVIVLNKDDIFLRSVLKKKTLQTIMTFSIDQPSDVQAKINKAEMKGIHFNVSRDSFVLPSPAVHNVYAALSAICCGRLFKLSYNNISKNIKNFKFNNGRFEVQPVGDFLLIDDSYNSNPLSLKAAINSLGQLKSSGKKILVCADMLELGRHSQRLHRDIGRHLKQSNVNVVLTYGRWAKEIHGVLKGRTHLHSRHFSDLENLHKQIISYCRPGDVLLVKGSRGMHLEKTVNYLKNHFA